MTVCLCDHDRQQCVPYSNRHAIRKWQVQVGPPGSARACLKQLLNRPVQQSATWALLAVQVADMLTGDSALPEDAPLVPDVATADGASSPLENQEVLYVSAEESIEQVNSSFMTEQSIAYICRGSPRILQVQMACSR